MLKQKGINISWKKGNCDLNLEIQIGGKSGLFLKYLSNSKLEAAYVGEREEHSLQTSAFS